jgi:glycosyltransferase involved in cell wall biosynthesis
VPNSDTDQRRSPHKPIVLLNASDAGSLINFRGKLIQTLVANGCGVHVSAPQITPDVHAQLGALGALVHEVPLARTGTNPISDLRYFLKLCQILRTVRPALVIGYTIKPNIWGSLAARLSGTRSASMVTGLGLTFVPGKGWKRRVLQQLMRKLYAIATRGNDRVVFQNPDDQRDFIAAGCLLDPNKAVLVNGSGVDLDHYALAPLPQRATFLMIARIMISKGVREYIEAAIAMMKDRDDCTFCLVGPLDDGPDAIPRAELDRWIESGITYLGSLQDVRPAIADASVYVLPSYREGTPRSVLEAMAMGRAVITTDAPGCRETVTHGRNGLLVPVGDANAVRQAMEALANDSKLRATYGKEGRAIATEKYAVDSVNSVLRTHLQI